MAMLPMAGMTAMWRCSEHALTAFPLSLIREPLADMGHCAQLLCCGACTDASGATPSSDQQSGAPAFSGS
jgi:hypothetical protein